MPSKQIKTNNLCANASNSCFHLCNGKLYLLTTRGPINESFHLPIFQNKVKCLFYEREKILVPIYQRISPDDAILESIYPLRNPLYFFLGARLVVKKLLNRPNTCRINHELFLANCSLEKCILSLIWFISCSPIPLSTQTLEYVTDIPIFLLVKTG